LQQWQDHLAQLRVLLADHARLAQQLQDLHERYLLLQDDPAVSTAERQAQSAAIVQAESEALQEALHVVHQVQDLLQENHRFLR
jgi:hypothetical protein